MTGGWKIGFIGAGKMGGAVARRLATRGHQVRVYDPSREATRACTVAGAGACDSAAEAASEADAVFTSLPLPEHVVDTYRSLVSVLEPGIVCVDVSTIDPIVARGISDLLAEREIPFVACPLGKTPEHAERGEIPVFVGGPRETVAFVHPLLEEFAESVHDLGTVEAATTFKLISNLVGMTNVAVLAEGYVLARRAG
ncbi:MAG: prephenate dehydrogenase/arogenate dehydrogenase family protein, partial [Actinophytocola sp.]|nr:prephenate dehydrogenase/arogenate dehydrogenase family protein [Actinophytocola sp.]